jgi:hypothetical protein
MKNALLAIMVTTLLGCGFSRNGDPNRAPFRRKSLDDVQFLVRALTSPKTERRALIAAGPTERNDIEDVDREMDRILHDKSGRFKIIWFNGRTPEVFEWDPGTKRLVFVTSKLVDTDFLVHVEEALNHRAVIRFGQWIFSLERGSKRLTFLGFTIVDPPSR